MTISFSCGCSCDYDEDSGEYVIIQWCDEHQPEEEWEDER